MHLFLRHTLTRRRGPVSRRARPTFRPKVTILEERCLLDATLLPGDLTLGSAAGRQEYAQIARGADSYLTVWTDTRTVLSEQYTGPFGGPDAGPGLGTMHDIYAARLDATGARIDTTPIVVSQTPYMQLNPRVGWNGQNWLVAWNTPRETNKYMWDLRVARIAPDGTVLDATPIVIKQSDSSATEFPPWSVSSDGGNWVVVWTDLTPSGQTSIAATRVSPDGTVLDPGGKTLYVAGVAWPAHADLAFAGDEYLLTWSEYSSVVRGQRLTPDLDPIGGVFTIAVGSRIESPRLATDGDRFFVAWNDEPSAGWYRLRAARISHTGQVLDPSGIGIGGLSGSPFGSTVPAWDGANWFVVHNRNSDVYVVRVSPAGQVLDQPVTRRKRKDPPPAFWGLPVKIDPATQLGLAVAAHDIHTAAVAANGQAGPDAAIALSAPRQSAPRLAFNGDGYLAVFRSEVSSVSRILAQRLDAAGNPIDVEPVVVAEGSVNWRNPAVAWNGSVYLVVWHNGSNYLGGTFGRLVGADGNVLGSAPFFIINGDSPDVAALGDTFLVTNILQQGISSPWRYVQSVRVSGSGTVLGTPAILEYNYNNTPRVVAFGGRWLVVWQFRSRHNSRFSAIHGAFVSPDGTPGPLFWFASDANNPHLAVAGDSALIAYSTGTWETGSSDIRGVRIAADGTFLGAQFAISAAAESQLRPAVAWDGSQYLVTWLDHRNDPFPGHPRGDIFAARVSVDGEVLDPNGFAVADSLLPEDTPTVAAANGMGIFAYAGLVNQAPYGTLRIMTRRLADFF